MIQNQSIAEILHATRTLVESPRNWAQNCVARTTNGREVQPWNPDASQWSVYGAIKRICGPFGAQRRGEVCKFVRDAALNGRSVMMWEDAEDLTHQHMLEVLDFCIREAGKTGK